MKLVGTYSILTIKIEKNKLVEYLNAVDSVITHFEGDNDNFDTIATLKQFSIELTKLLHQID